MPRDKNSPAGLEACLVCLEAVGEIQLAVEGPTPTFFTPGSPASWPKVFWVFPIPTQPVRERRGGRKTDPQDAVLIAHLFGVGHLLHRLAKGVALGILRPRPGHL